MADEYRVRGGVGPPLPGTVSPAGVDGRSEWVPVRRGADLLDVLSGRLGSEVEPHHVALAVLAPLAAALAGAPLASLLAHLPAATGVELAAAADESSGVRPATGAGDYLVEVARLVQQPPWRAAATVRAVFASARAVLTPEELEAIAAQLPRDLVEAFRKAS
jgi:uncharacterized protein (DUF2267 family)